MNFDSSGNFSLSLFLFLKFFLLYQTDLLNFGIFEIDVIKSEEKNKGHFQKNWPLLKKLHIFCPIIIKLGENNYLMR